MRKPDLRRFGRSLLPRSDTLREDVLAAVPGAVSSVPDGMASAVLVGVNPIHGLYASAIGPIFGGYSASTRLMVITTTTVAALAAGWVVPEPVLEDVDEPEEQRCDERRGYADERAQEREAEVVAGGRAPGRRRRVATHPSACRAAKNSSALRVFVDCSPVTVMPRSIRKFRASSATSNASAGAHFVESSRIRVSSG
jgi:Sulfate permease family